MASGGDVVRRHSSPAIRFHTTWCVVVVAVQAQRLPELLGLPRRGGSVSRPWARPCGQASPVGARAVGSGGAARRGGAVGVHGPERGCGEGEEHARVLERPRRGRLCRRRGRRARAGRCRRGRSRRTTGTRRPAVAARGVDHPVGHGAGGPGRDQFAGGGVDGVHGAFEPDRVGAGPGGLDVLQPRAVPGSGGPLNRGRDGRTGVVVLGGNGLPPGAWGVPGESPAASPPGRTGWRAAGSQGEPVLVGDDPKVVPARRALVDGREPAPAGDVPQ